MSASVVGAVLAGGAGTRLGGAKPGALLAGRPLAVLPGRGAAGGARRRSRSSPRTTRSCRPSGTGVLVWREPAEPRHPLAGVVEALRRAEGRAVVVLACDLPFVTADLVRDAGRRGRRRRARGRRAPRPSAACSRSAPATSRQALAALAGVRPGRPHDHAGPGAASPPPSSVPDARLRNVNTHDDLAAAEAALAGSRAAEVAQRPRDAPIACARRLSRRSRSSCAAAG